VVGVLNNIIRISGGEPEFDTPHHIIDAMKRALDEGHTHYGDFAGVMELREAIAGKYEGYGVKAEPGHVLVTPGSTQGIYQTLKAVTKPGDDVLCMDPCFFAYYSTFEFLGLNAVTVPRYSEEGWRFHVDELGEAVTPRTRAILYASPDNPTGAVLSEGDIRGIAEVAENSDLYVISDDIYDMITYDGVRFRSIASLSSMRERTLILNGFSKSYAMTGWRLGYIIAPTKELYDRLMTIQMATYLVVNAAVQRAGVAALTGPQDCVHEMVKSYDEKRRYVLDRYEEIDGIVCHSPQGAFYMFPDASSYGMSSAKLCETLLKEGKVAVMDGRAFGSMGEGHYRQAFAQSMEALSEGLDRIERTLGKLR
jgi:aminotransferase